MSVRKKLRKTSIITRSCPRIVCLAPDSFLEIKKNKNLENSKKKSRKFPEHSKQLPEMFRNFCNFSRNFSNLSSRNVLGIFSKFLKNFDKFIEQILKFLEISKNLVKKNWKLQEKAKRNLHDHPILPKNSLHSSWIVICVMVFWH